MSAPTHIELRDGTIKAIEPSLKDQRRYEIAKAVLAGFAGLDYSKWGTSFDSAGDTAKCAVQWADALLAELEK